jgi:trafficking protein particle complex subunit 10
VVVEASVIPSARGDSLGRIQYFAGQPLQATCSFRTTFRWGQPPLKNCDINFEVEENRNDWVVSGQKKGSFRAKVCHIILVTLDFLAYVITRKG